MHCGELSAMTSAWRYTPRCPAVPVAISLGIGILADSRIERSFPTWLVLTASALICALLASRSGFRSLTSLAVLAACSSLGAAWHHCWWNGVAEDEVALWASDSGTQVRLRGRVLQRPLVLVSSTEKDTPWRNAERTVLLLDIRQLRSPTGDEPASGRLRVTVAGPVSSVAIGDVIEVQGRLTRPPEPMNPGEFDLRHWLRSQRIHAMLQVDTPESLVITGQELTAWIRLAAFRASVRERAERLFATNLRPETAGVAQSLLLGSRGGLDDDLRRAFAESGTLHVLAISGMNVGLLYGWLWFICRALRYSPRVSLAACLILLPAYAFLTDANPPVVRATIVAVLLALGQLMRRQSSQWNALAVAAILVLAANPTDLFNSGAQLSFLAVAALLLTSGYLGSLSQLMDPGDHPLLQSTAALVIRWIGRQIIQGYLLSLSVWVMTSPLIAAQFHLVSPMGFVLSVLLSPLIAVMFWFGYLFLLLGLISPTLFGLLGWPFDLTLGWFLDAVRAAAQLKLGHSYIPAPPAWWTAGFYGLTIVLVLIDHARRRIYWSARGLLAWSVIGLAVSLATQPRHPFRCTVLAVKHGLSVLLELPDGRRLLYDAGSMSGSERTAQIIERAVWASGQSRLDAVIVSHPDADHCNALARLVQVIPVGTVFVHRTFLDWSQPAVAMALDGAEAAKIPIRLISGGQRLQADPRVQLSVVHPGPDFRSATDNSNSVVLLIEMAGRRLLLTGDLEKDGLYHLLMHEQTDVDLLVAPHHGSVTANPPDLARWATPEWLIVSSRDDGVTARLSPRYGPSTQILSTSRDGAIRCEIAEDGELALSTYRKGGWQTEGSP